jgi:hypothetical protein
METVSNLFTAEYKAELIKIANEKFNNDLAECNSTFEKAMCKAELDSNLKKIDININPFKTERPGDSDFECVGCGS